MSISSVSSVRDRRQPRECLRSVPTPRTKPG